MVEKDILNFIDTANLKSGLLKKKKKKNTIQHIHYQISPVFKYLPI